MFFIKDDTTGREVELWEEDIYTYCPECGKRLYPFKDMGIQEFLDGFPEDYDFDFISATLICEDCIKKIKADEKGKTHLHDYKRKHK